MTTPMPVNLKCPCCGNEFESMSFSSTNTFGPMTTDLYRQAAGFPSLPLMVHGCEQCGYSGDVSDFRKELTPELKAWVRQNLVKPDRFDSDAQYENSARFAEHQSRPPYHVAQLWLRAGWCANTRSEAGVRYRREAVLRFEAATDAGQVPKDERALTTYLIGELHRRVGNADKAKVWFARVPDAVGGDTERQWLIDLAIQQSTDPKEMADDGPGR